MGTLFGISVIVTHTTPFVYIFNPSLPFLPFLLFFFFSSIHHILSGVLITPLSMPHLLSW